MKKETLVSNLKRWLKFESCVDVDGNISPSKTAIDSVHFYFVQDTRYTRNIDTITIDQQGGIVINVSSTSNLYRYVVHVAFDGFITYYEVHDDGYVEKVKINRKKEKGFGTEGYQF